MDPLVGLKENVIIGKLIPAGVGMRRYKSIEVFDAGAASHVANDPVLHVDEL